MRALSCRAAIGSTSVSVITVQIGTRVGAIRNLVMRTAGCRVAAIRSANIVIITIQRSGCTSGRLIAGVRSADVVVVADYRSVITARSGIAAIRSAGIAVITIHRHI